MTRDSWRFDSVSKVIPEGQDSRQPILVQKLVGQGYLVLNEGKTFHQFNDIWGNPSRYLVDLSKCYEKTALLEGSRYFRLQIREISRATDERTAISCIQIPGTVNSLTATNERTPWSRPSYIALYLCAVFNSFAFDWSCRHFVQTHLTLGILSNLRIPNETSSEAFLTHSALRLTCNHSGYKFLWREQLGDEWREADKDPFTFPVLATEDDRWSVRAAIDAVVAQAYGLARDQYAHVLSTFSHKSYPKAPQLCLDRFDELEAIGLEAFTQKYDPYWDIPLNENLPKPVIDLPIPDLTPEAQQGSLDLGDVPTQPKRQRRKKS
ncbi:MAG: hypothetical protein HC899_36135 [Leptolyngbyaceae cyanobacterium SM1_4_3]|nr:hypothetical protein [Leptolyngbyaceae cyanobacterium SM1_4_3]